MPWISFENKDQADLFLASLYDSKSEVADFSHKTRSEKDVYATKAEWKLLSQHIRLFYEKELIRSIYKKRFYGLTQIGADERIYELSENFAKDSQLVSDMLSSDVLQLMEKAEQLNVKGAKDFSLLNYKNVLENIVERGIEEFAVERERKSFIDLLRYFVSLQNVGYRVIHIVNNDGFYRILDEQYNEIHFYNTSSLYNDLFTDISTEEDWVLSLLITIAPKRIVLHDRMQRTPEHFVETLIDVFEQRIKVCHGCSYCENNT